jgi:hypothetical protein
MHERAGSGPEPDSQDVFNSPPRSIRVEQAALPPALLTFDGANEQIEPIMRSTLGRECQRNNIGLFKWAAACSLVQQPNDVSPCHKILHEHKQTYTEGKAMPAKFGWITDVMERHKFAPGHKKTFTDFYAHLEELLHNAFNPAAIKAGWRVSGSYSEEHGGVDTDAIMGGWNPGSRKENGCWENMSDIVRDEIRSTFETLADIGMSKGEISDADIESTKCASGRTLKDLMENILGADIPDWMKIQPEDEHGNPGVGINLRRCILLSHEKWLEAARAGRIAAGRSSDFDHSRCGCGVKGVNTATHRDYVVKLSQKILNPLSVVMWKGQPLEVHNGDAAVPLARAALETARLQAEMEDESRQLAAERAANQGAAAAPINAAVDLNEEEQERLDAEYFNAQAGMQMD